MKDINLENLELLLVDTEEGTEYFLNVAPNYPDLEELKQLEKPVFLSVADERTEHAIGLTRTQTKELIAHLEMLLDVAEG